MDDMSLLKKELFLTLKEKGAKLVGVGNLSGIVDSDMHTGICVAIPLPRQIVQDLQIAPTQEYYHAYHSLNSILDEIVLSGSEFLNRKGYKAYANTTKAVKQNEEWRTPLPHKTVATRAGLGWVGKSCLLVTKKYGSAIRLSSLITNAPLPCDSPITQSQCGTCNICVQKCPGKALTGKLWTPDTAREELFHREICYQTQLQRMKSATGIEADLCGLCFAVCPYTQQWLNGMKSCHWPGGSFPLERT